MSYDKPGPRPPEERWLREENTEANQRHLMAVYRASKGMGFAFGVERQKPR